MTHPIPSRIDVAIIGAGPSGTTLASLLKKYRPESSVWVFEREVFPRHKVGEGLIVDINRVLHDMDALDVLENHGFPQKFGTTFVWGAERRPSTFLFKEGLALVGCPDGYQLEYTWHVDRPTYDHLLAQKAEDHGAQVAFGHHVDRILEEEGRVVGLEVLDAEGQRHTVRTSWVVDCAGGSGPLTRERGERQLDADLRNIALFGYHRDLAWRDDLQGPPELRRTLIMTHPKGWVWFIPISRTETSVGFVTSVQSYQEEKARRGGVLDPESYYQEVLRELPEYDDLFTGSELFNYRQTERKVHVVQEFSYSCDQVWGPGWVTCGDGAGFVDAILSIGCYIAQAHAQFLAYALGSVLSGECDEDLGLGSYQTTVTENLSAFRSVAHMFYAYNSSRSDWWRDCSRLVRDSAYIPDGNDKASFLAFANGFTARHGMYEEAVNAFGNMFLVGLGECLFPEEELFDEERMDTSIRGARALLKSDPVLELCCSYQAEEFALPKTGTGKLVRVTRLVFDRATTPGQEIARRLVVPAGLEQVMELLNGSRKVSDVRAAVSLPVEAVDNLLLRLLCAGAARKRAAKSTHVAL
jgi:flavin-dependent dehydrogenase